MKRTIAAAAVAVLALLLLPAPDAHAQMPVTAIGRVVDAQGNPVPDVQVQLEYKGPIPQKYKTKTDKKGVFTHVNVYAGPYRLTLKKEGVGEVTINANIQEVESIQKPPEYKFAPKPAAAAAPPPAGIAPTAGAAAAAVGAPPVNSAKIVSDINAAAAMAKEGRLDDAIAAYQAIVATAPVPLVHSRLGMLYKEKADKATADNEKNDDRAKAEAELRKAIELDPTFVEGYLDAATFLRDSGKTQEAVDVVKKGVEQNPQSGLLQYALGVLMESTDPAMAKEALLKAEQLDPKNFETQYHLATVALNQNDKAEAISRLEKFVAAAPAGTPNVDVAKSLMAALQQKK